MMKIKNKEKERKNQFERQFQITANDLKSSEKAELLEKLTKSLFPRINIQFLSGFFIYKFKTSQLVSKQEENLEELKFNKLNFQETDKGGADSAIKAITIQEQIAKQDNWKHLIPKSGYAKLNSKEQEWSERDREKSAKTITSEVELKWKTAPQLELDIKFNSKGVMISSDMFFMLDKNVLVFQDWVNGFKMDFKLQGKDVRSRPFLKDSKLMIDADTRNEAAKDEPGDNVKHSNLQTILKTIPLKDFARDKLMNLVNLQQNSTDKNLQSVEQDTNFDEFRMIQNKQTFELLIVGGFIQNESEVKFLDEVICLNLQDFLLEYERVQDETEELMKRTVVTEDTNHSDQDIYSQNHNSSEPKHQTQDLNKINSDISNRYQQLRHMMHLIGQNEQNHFTTTHLKMNVAKSSFALAFTPLKHRLCVIGGLNDEQSQEIMDSSIDMRTKLNIFQVDVNENPNKKKKEIKHKDLITNVNLSHSKFKRCANILPFACVQGGAVFLDETNVFIVFGGLGLGSRKVGILNIDKGSVGMVADLLTEDICSSGMLQKIESEGTMQILLMGKRSIQLQSLDKDEWYDVGNIDKLQKQGIDGRWISFVEISDNFN